MTITLEITITSPTEGLLYPAVGKTLAAALAIAEPVQCYNIKTGKKEDLSYHIEVK